MGNQPEPAEGYAGAAVSVAPAPTLRAEFGAHLETNYPRLVAQLCMITLNPAEAQDLVQEAYARAWQRWADVRELHDPTGWVRQAAVRASDRRWRRLMGRLGLDRNRSAGSPSDDPQHEGLLSALRRIPIQQRRILVLVDVAHLPLGEVADIESIDINVVEARLAQARRDLDGYLSGYVASQAASQPPAVNWEDM
jgi:RNA polymerase sigma-70 factor (ECF subfamily)